MQEIPDWVQSLSDEDIKKATIIELLKSGVKSLDSPREINFTVSMIDSNKVAKQISKRLKELGWKTEIIEDAGDGSGYWVEAQKLNYVISEHQLYEDEKFFFELANSFGAVYDGWYAEAV